MLLINIVLNNLLLVVILIYTNGSLKIFQMISLQILIISLAKFLLDQIVLKRLHKYRINLNLSVKVAVDLFFNELISTSGSEDELLQKVIPDVILLMNENVSKDKKLCDKAN